MTLSETCEQVLSEMDQTIRKFEEVVERMKRTRKNLLAARSLPRQWSLPENTNLNEGPHFPGLG